MTPDRRRAITAVVWKDLRVAMASKSVVLPLAIVPVIFILVLPIALALLAPTNRIVGRCAASQIASASAMSFFCRFTNGFT